jgi:hypothetical protein
MSEPLITLRLPGTLSQIAPGDLDIPVFGELAATELPLGYPFKARAL